MKRHGIGLLVFVLFAALSFTSCGKKPNISVSSEQLSFPYTGGLDCFQIKADCEWTIGIGGANSWCSCSPTSGSGDSTILVSVQNNNTQQDRVAVLNIVSADGRTAKAVKIVQEQIDMSVLCRKVWFARFYERWNTDYLNDSIVDSYRSWLYSPGEGYLNWFFYFLEDGTGYEIRTENTDTIYYPFQHCFYPERDSLDIIFQVEGDTTMVEDYHVTVMELNDERFVIRNQYRPHHFEKITSVNVTGNKGVFKLNPDPKKLRRKSSGPLISVE